MITKYNDFLNEKLSYKLSGFNEEELKQQLLDKKITFEKYLNICSKYKINLNKNELKEMFLDGKTNETFTNFFILCNKYNIKVFSDEEIYNQIKKLSPNDNVRILRSSASSGYLEIIKYLVEHGADIHADDNILLKLASDGHLNVVKYLVEHGADIHADNNYALRNSANDGDLEMVKFLVEHGADIHANDDEALIWSAEEEHSDIVKYLVEHGADITVLNNKYLNQEIQKIINTL